MKKLLMICSFAIFFVQTYGQTEQGKFLLDAESSLSLSFMSAKLKYDGQTIGDNTNITQFTFNPGFGYFFADNLAMGLSVSIENTSYKVTGSTASSTMLAIGPFLRGYVGSGNIKPFFQGQIGLGSETQKEDTDKLSFSGLAYGFGAGVAFFLNDKVALNFSVSYAGTSMKNSEDSNAVATGGGVNVGLGFAIHL